MLYSWESVEFRSGDVKWPLPRCRKQHITLLNQALIYCGGLRKKKNVSELSSEILPGGYVLYTLRSQVFHEHRDT